MCNLVSLLFLSMTGAVAFGSLAEEGQQFEGDIVLNPDQLGSLFQLFEGSQFAALKTKHWKTNGVAIPIPYYIEPSIASSLKAKSAISAAVKAYRDYTCIKFERVEKKPNGPHLSIFKGDGCWSYVGRQATGQRISLASGCWEKGIVMHEFGHALGLIHTQSRPDRDNYITIIRGNIKPETLSNFNKYSTYSASTLGLPYDYYSMMHYSQYAFQKAKGLITIRTKDPKYQHLLGYRSGFSYGDIKLLKKLYCSITPCYNLVSSYQCWLWKPLCKVNKGVRRKCRKYCGLC